MDEFSKNTEIFKDSNVISTAEQEPDANKITTKIMTENANVKNSDDAPTAKKEPVAGPSTEGKSRKVHDEGKNTNAKKKVATHPPVAEMVLESIKALKKRNGASVDDITAHIGENYEANVKTLKTHIVKFLKKSEEGRVLEKITGANSQEKFKIKKEAKKDNQKLMPKKRKVELKKKIPKTKKPRKI